MKPLITIFIALSVLLAACGDDPSVVSVDSDTSANADTNAETRDTDTNADTDTSADTNGDSPLSLDRRWVLTRLTIDGESLTLPSSPLGMTIDGSELSASVGCNSLSGSIEIEANGALDIDQATQTERGCEFLDLEMAYIAALTTVSRWEATPDQLTFVSDDVRITYAPSEG